MKEYGEVSRLPDPSSADPKPKDEEPFVLDADAEAEASIKVKGITTDMLIDAVFQGLDLKTYDDVPLTRTMMAGYINSAIATAEQTFDICISPRDIEGELHDFEGNDVSNFGFTRLFYRPVREVESISIQFGNRKIFDVPSNWIQLDRLQGDITLIPVSGSVGIVMPAEGTILPHFMQRNYVPMAKTINYSAGMDFEDVPANLLEFILKRAGIGVLQIWGDQIIGAGIANQSLSIDGLSQSIGTTQSAMYGGASARIDDYRKDLAELTPVIRRQFERINMTVL